jgi:hypothetical protein
MISCIVDITPPKSEQILEKNPELIAGFSWEVGLYSTSHSYSLNVCGEKSTFK